MRWQLLAIFLLAYVFTAKGYVMVIDTSYSVDTAEAIVTRGAIDIPAREGASVGKDGRSYSKYGIGLALALIPEVAAAHAVAKVTHAPEHDVAGFFISFLNVPFALLALWTFMRILRRFGASELNVTLLGIALGLGTLVWHYAVSDCSEVMQCALLLVAFDRATCQTTRSALASGFAVAALILVKAVHVTFAPLFFVYLVACAPGALPKRAKDAVVFAAPVAASLVFQLVFNSMRFGSPFESGYGRETTGFSMAQWPHTIPALLVSLDKGAYVFCPVLLLGLLGLRAFFRRMPREATLVAALVGANFLLIAAFVMWTGGWCLGPRYLVPLFPFWLLPAVFWLEEERSSRRFAVASALTCASIVVQVPGVLIRDQEVHHIHSQLTVEEQQQMDGDEVSMWVIFLHKLEGRDEVYSVADFGVASNRTIDLESVRTFHGWNVWPARLAEQVHRPAVRWLSPLALLAAVVLLGRLAAGLWSDASARRALPATVVA